MSGATLQKCAAVRVVARSLCGLEEVAEKQEEEEECVFIAAAVCVCLCSL